MSKENQPTDEVTHETALAETEPVVSESPNKQNTDDETLEETDEDEPKGPNIMQRLLAAYKAKKKLTIPATVLLFLLILFGVPFTRYRILALVVKKNVQVRIIDSQTNVPVSGVEVSLRGKTAKTDGEGKAVLQDVRVGYGELKATKKYYKDTTTVRLTGLKTAAAELKLEATGRQVAVHITHKISGESVEGAVIKAADTEAQTDSNGETTLVLPANQQKIEAVITKPGYNDQKVRVTISNATIKDNTFRITPTGKVYFLSKQTGKIDVVKTDLDGNNRQTVLAGTGNEEDGNTILLASRDWKYLALLARREDSKARLYLIETGSDKLTEIDSGDATFTLVGWSGHTFAYTVGRNNVQAWQPKEAALKSYNAESLKLQTIDETNAEGTGVNDYANENFGNAYILKDSLIYTKQWNAAYHSIYRLAGKRMGIYSAKASGSKQTVRDFDAGANAYFNARLYKPNEIYFGLYNNGAGSFYEYKDGMLQGTTGFNGDIFGKFYPTYLVSPNGEATFWYEPRDGKNSLFIGNLNGENSKQAAALSEYVPYGWFTDDYLLVSKNDSELYIQAVSAVSSGLMLKISDYHKPAYNFQGYGYGYGGF